MNHTLSVRFFGQLTDLTGCVKADVPAATDTEELKRVLDERYPLLRKATYVVTVDRKIVRENTALAGHTEVALLPPFSGG